jgi:hypothetical protein
LAVADPPVERAPSFEEPVDLLVAVGGNVGDRDDPEPELDQLAVREQVPELSESGGKAGVADEHDVGIGGRLDRRERATGGAERPAAHEPASTA